MVVRGMLEHVRRRRRRRRSVCNIVIRERGVGGKEKTTEKPVLPVRYYCCLLRVPKSAAGRKDEIGRTRVAYPTGGDDESETTTKNLRARAPPPSFGRKVPAATATRSVS